VKGTNGETFITHKNYNHVQFFKKTTRRKAYKRTPAGAGTLNKASETTKNNHDAIIYNTHNGCYRFLFAISNKIKTKADK